MTATMALRSSADVAFIVGHPNETREAYHGRREWPSLPAEPELSVEWTGRRSC